MWNDFLVPVTYAALIIAVVAAVVLAGCGITRGIRGSGACSFFGQGGGKRRGRIS
jgi:hypothetical protein